MGAEVQDANVEGPAGVVEIAQVDLAELRQDALRARSLSSSWMAMRPEVVLALLDRINDVDRAIREAEDYGDLYQRYLATAPDAA